MNSTRITSDDTSRVSLGIGLGVAALTIGVVLYFALAAHALTKETNGFDPNRPVTSDATLRSRLKPDQYRITRENGTETAFQNEYWNNVRPASMSTLSLASRFFVRSTNLTAAPDAQ